MKDFQGKWRGVCQVMDCSCDDYMMEGGGRACDYCNHSYDQHCIIGPCQTCTGGERCDGYDQDEGERDKSCSYCDHSIDVHKIIKTSLPTCKLPGCTQPCFKEPNGHVHDFCGRTHARAYQSGMSSKPKCSCPGCSFPRYVDGQGHMHECCSRKCAIKYAQVKGYMQAPVRMPSGTVNKMKGAEQNNTIQHFLDSWTKGGKPGQHAVKAVYQVLNDPMKTDYDQYCKSLRDPNVDYFYHGTVLKCPILETDQLCSDPSCGVCGISHSGFLTSKLGQHVSRFQRFGLAFYLAPNSSKCHEYTEGHRNGYRALLLCEVAQGRCHFATSNMKDLIQPPPGFDSVYGKPGTHEAVNSSLNYAELAVYNSNAILPKFIIVYEKDGIELKL